jgi:hypothetical protein
MAFKKKQRLLLFVYGNKPGRRYFVARNLCVPGPRRKGFMVFAVAPVLRLADAAKASKEMATNSTQARMQQTKQ